MVNNRSAVDALQAVAEKHGMNPSSGLSGVVTSKDKDAITLNCKAMEAFALLFAAYHTASAFEPEYAVFNPHPKMFVKEYMLPRDVYLWKESNELARLDLKAFISYCKQLIATKEVRCIGAMIGTNNSNDIRLNVTAEFNPEWATKSQPVAAGSYPCMATVVFAVSGGLKRENELTLKRLYVEIKELADSISV